MPASLSARRKALDKSGVVDVINVLNSSVVGSPHSPRPDHGEADRSNGEPQTIELVALVLAIQKANALNWGK
jgi:hypothetical protein